MVITAFTLGCIIPLVIYSITYSREHGKKAIEWKRKIRSTLMIYYCQAVSTDDYMEVNHLCLIGAGIAKIDIRMNGTITISASRPGILIGKRGKYIDSVLKGLHSAHPETKFTLNIQEYSVWTTKSIR
jgi:ribosomal protein S3